MNNFKYLIEQDEKSVTIELSGRMDEGMDLPAISQFDDQIVSIDFEEVTFINSLGIRTWIHWLEKHAFKELSFKNLPLCIIDQVNMVEGFLPLEGKVNSFYMPFVCEDCDLETHHHLRDGDHFIWSEQVPDEKSFRNLECEECQQPLEPCVQERKFFQFLHRSLKKLPLAA